MNSSRFLLDLSFILISTKALGLLSRKVHMPQVVGALIAGLILGPSVLDAVMDTDFIKQTAELGVILILFAAGLKVDLYKIKSSGKTALLVAMLGVLFPMVMGFIVSYVFMLGLDSASIMRNIFIGTILTATSVSISVETLKEMGKLKSEVGTAIVTAALIDDVISIVLLAAISGFASGSSSSGLWSLMAGVLVKIVAFFVFSGIVGLAFHKVFQTYSDGLSKKRRFPIIALSFCFMMAFISEHFFGIADITGAFIAGVVFFNTDQSEYIYERVDELSYLYLTPVFFASIGISSNLKSIDSKMIYFGLMLLLIAIVSKVIGCGLGAKISGFSNSDSLKVGVGMSARSEVALIVANSGVMLGAISSDIFPVIILLVIASSIITPVLLKLSYNSKD
ncbi:Na(+)/H(+)-K(+) antiporter GerN [Andreesenia angusta]|uniref:Na(+)/H(+)-K(+) antiporter GerN n=1 Tax=Andreesenia angusta TaxID=39480 RepID=A0A1S1V9P5_9FIRM|nr:cation:proton antiporter [Andreesenia angusta]OHW63341.1 Na(+)/H(+)-K(+) antiporter GerN [Andreesenia angusta]